MKRFNSKGVSLIELLVGIGMISIFFVSAAKLFLTTARDAYDSQVMLETDEQAIALMDLVTSELRSAGAGMPMGQASFDINDVTLGDAPRAILTTSDADTINFRVSENGVDTVLTADFVPTSTSRTFTVMSAAEFAVGDTVYISDMVRGGTEGLKGTIGSISGSNITINTGYVKSVGSTFTSGSTVAKVRSISYNSPSDWTGVTRAADGGSAEIVVPNSTFALKYYNSAGTELVPPLPTDIGGTNLVYTIEITVTVRSLKILKGGTHYDSTLVSKVSPRNMYLTYG